MDAPATTAGKAPVLDVKGLKTVFHTMEGTIHAVNGVSFYLRAGFQHTGQVDDSEVVLKFLL